MSWFSVKGQLPESGLRRLRHGLVLDGKPLLPAEVDWMNRDQLRFVIPREAQRSRGIHDSGRSLRNTERRVSTRRVVVVRGSSLTG
jgi:16S rRNA U516 pseudouridylate synthase RsuA-like enzyme